MLFPNDFLPDTAGGAPGQGLYVGGGVGDVPPLPPAAFGSSTHSVTMASYRVYPALSSPNKVHVSPG